MPWLLWFRYSTWLLLASAGLAQGGLAAATDCGDVVNVATHEQTALRALFGVGNIRRLHILWAIHEHT